MHSCMVCTPAHELACELLPCWQSLFTGSLVTSSLVAWGVSLYTLLGLG